ncbi:MAG: non-ribosomal peptide synthetase [Cyanobacteriota bacterium]|jgi:amino acid adenylation domain-containing protein
MSGNLGQRLARLSPKEIRALVNGLNRAPAALARMGRNPGQQYPLSAAQERIWFLTQLSPNSRAFNNPAAMRVRVQSPLDPARLGTALNEVGRRHEIFRTTFHLEAGKPVQIIHDELPLPLTWEDLRSLPPTDLETQARRIGIEEGCRLFDLAKGPLLALKLLRLDENEYLMLVTSHHIISDGWSNAQLARELTALSEGVELPPVELQYVDYVAWERDWLESAAAHAQLDFWKSRIDTDISPIELPRDRSRPTHAIDAGGMETLTLPQRTVDRLRGLARSEKTSLFPLMMAALALLLYRLSGEECFVIGTVAANRNQRAFQKVMGPLLNQLAIPFEVPPDATARRVLHCMITACQEALRNQELPFNVLLNELQVRRDLGAHPLFQVMLVHQNVPAQYASAGMDVEVMKLDYGTTKLDLNFWIEEINEGLVVTLHYASALFDRQTVRRILSDYARAVACLCDSLDTPLADLSLFEKEDFPVTVRSIPLKEEDLVTRFAEQAKRTPQAQAVIGKDGVLTYAELDARANLLAHRLLAEGASVDNPVALLTRRSCGTVVALLGILKAGAPYLPLDLSQPLLRHRSVMADADASMVVCDSETEAIAEQIGAVCIQIDTIEMAPAIVPISPKPEAIAYLIYTSGTTGAPKGVCVEHRNVVAYSDAIWERMDLKDGDHFASLSSIATDLGNTMLFSPLLHGGCVVFCPDDVIGDPPLLAQFFERYPVACFKVTPAHLHALLLCPELLPSKLLLLGGEVATPALIDRVRSFAPGLRILNHYGPTETTVGVLTYEVPDPWPGGPIPLGTPLGHAEVRVLDTAGRPLPIGVIGELYIGGPTLTRGYWRDPALTAERFVSASDGMRLYRTGDLGKYLANGNYTFHGRADRQIKIRGYRVEPGEIEAAVEKHSAVAQAAVRVTTTGRLICYVVLLAPTQPSNLIAFLREILPTVMVPSAIIPLQSFPRTPAGKIDLESLPLPSQLPIAPANPRDPLELKLMNIWQEVLDLETVGIYDSFFELGGHSLLAVQLMAKIKTDFGLDLPLATLFTHDSIANLAILLRRQRILNTGPLVTIRTGAGVPSITPSIACVHPAGGDVLCYYPLVQAFSSIQSIYGLCAQSSDGSPSIEDLASRYVDALPSNSTPMLLGWSMGALVAFEMARQWEVRSGAMPRLAILDQLAPQPTTPSTRGGEADAELMLAFAAKISALVGEDIGIGLDQIDSNPEVVFLAAFQRYGLAPEDVQVEDFSRYLHLMLDHNRAVGAYRPATPYSGEILVLRAEESLTVGSSEVSRPADLGWQQWCLGNCTVMPVPGNHVTMMRSPHVSQLARALEQGWRLA